MPVGNAGFKPSSIWIKNPHPNLTYPGLVLGTVTSFAFWGLVFWGIYEYRSLGWKYTYPSFVGKTTVYGNLTTLTHEPATTEQIDRLREEQARKKELKYIGFTK